MDGRSYGQGLLTARSREKKRRETRRLTLCTFRLSTVRKAYGSLSFPSHLTVVPTRGWERMRSAKSCMGRSWASALKSWVRRRLVAR